MLAVGLSFLVIFGASGDETAGVAPVESGRARLEAIAQSAAAATSYSCDYVVTRDQGGEDALAATDWRAARKRLEAGGAWNLRFERGKAERIARGPVAVYRGETKYVSRDAKGERWIPFEREEVSRLAAVGGEKAREDRARGVMRLFVEIERIPLPHDVLASLPAKVEEVSFSEQDGGATVVLVATLSRRGALELAGLSEPDEASKGRPEPEIGEGAPRDPESGEQGDRDLSARARQKEIECSGSVRVVLAGGAVELIEIELLMKGGMSRRLRQVFGVSGWNATSVEMPDDVAAALAGR